MVKPMAVICLLLVGVLTADILTVLPELQRKPLKIPAQSYTIRSKEHFLYEFGFTEEPDTTIVSSNGADAKNYCNFKNHRIELDEVQSFEFSREQLDSATFGSNSVAVSYQQGLIYFINQELKVTAFYFNNTHLTKAASETLPINKSLNQEGGTGIVMLASEDGNYVFVFSPYGIWRINTRGVVSNIHKLDTPFTASVNEGVVVGGLLILSSLKNGMTVFEMDVAGTLRVVSQFNRYERNEIHPVSIAVNREEGLIFLLDQVENIYVFQISKSRITNYDIISFKHNGNLKIRVDGQHVLYSFVENNNFKICELLYVSKTRQAELVRYFKLFDYITDFFLRGREMLVFSIDLLDWFPIGVDPRLIKREHNGVRIQSSARRVVQLSQELYLLTDDKSLRLSWLRIRTPRLECNFDTQHTQIVMTAISNFSACSTTGAETDEVNFVVGGRYNEYCEVHRTINIDVDIPEKQERQAILVYGVIAIFVVMFLLGTFCLLQWRNSQIELIDYVTDKIKKYQQKDKLAHRKLAEEQPPRSEERRSSEEGGSQPVEIEMQPTEPLADHNPRTDEQLVVNK